MNSVPSGLSKPALRLNNGVVTEGDEVTARCAAPGEKGRIYFYLYKDSKVISEHESHTNQSETKVRFSGSGVHRIHCTYAVIVTPDSFKSEESNTVTVSVRGGSNGKHKWVHSYNINCMFLCGLVVSEHV